LVVVWRRWDSTLLLGKRINQGADAMRDLPEEYIQLRDGGAGPYELYRRMK
jgi:hypothetical protein